MPSKARIVAMTMRLHDAAVALGTVLFLLTAFCSGQEDSTPEPVAQVKAIVADETGAVIAQSEVRNSVRPMHLFGPQSRS